MPATFRGRAGFSGEDEYATSAGLLHAQQDRNPAIGGSFRFGAFRFDIVQTSDRRIERVRISRTPDEREQE